MSLKQIEKYFDRLWPICRSILGSGYRDSLDILTEIVPFKRLSFTTGKRVLDWIVPEEWHIQDAYFIDPQGKRHAEFKVHNLHILNYSTPFEGKLPWSEFKQHLYTLPQLPRAIPYLTSYYKRRWGFCLPHQEYQALPKKGMYQVVIKSQHKPGRLVVGEAVLKGRSSKEILFSTYLCHPSMANNELSGPLVMAFLYQRIAKMKNRKWTYRFVIGPETIGAVAYLSRRRNHLKKNLLAAYLLTSIGDDNAFTYKASRAGNTLADTIAKEILKQYPKSKFMPFSPSAGSDERQYCSPGFNFPMGSIMRTTHSDYKEYHSSLDNKEFVSFEAMQSSVNMLTKLVRRFERTTLWVNSSPYGEPQLIKHDLYTSLGSQRHLALKWKVLLWLLNLSDGTHDIKSMSQKSGHSAKAFQELALILEKKGMLKQV